MEEDDTHHSEAVVYQPVDPLSGAAFIGLREGLYYGASRDDGNNGKAHSTKRTPPCSTPRPVNYQRS